MDVSDIDRAPEPAKDVAKEANDYLSKHLDEAVERYRKENTSAGTLAISSDAARELLPGYAAPAERTANNFALGPASSKLAEAVWQRSMSDGPTTEKYAVTFLTGSPGSGKTSSTLTDNQDGSQHSPIAIISEGMMDHFEKSAARIQQAIHAGFVPTLRLMYAIDPRTTLRRATARAMDHGRPVAISQMSRLYVEIPKTVARLAEHFGDKIGVRVFDNSADGRAPKDSNLETALRATGEYTEATAKEAMLDELEGLRNTGKISPELYRQFRGNSTPTVAATSGRPGGPKGPLDHGGSNRQDQPRGEGSGAVADAEPRAPKKGKPFGAPKGKDGAGT